MEFRFEVAFVRLPDYGAEIHGLDREDNPIVLQARGGEHRQWFEDTGREWRPNAAASAVPAEPPLQGGEVAWLEWLSARSDFEDAVRVMEGNAGSSNWESLRVGADTLRHAALRLRDTQPVIARWLATRSLDQYYAWMSQATSGGEGGAMQFEVGSELRELGRLLDEIKA